MDRPARWQRGLYLATAVGALGGIAVQLGVTAGVEEGFFDTRAARVLNVFAYFTILSNLLVGVTSLLLVIDPARNSPAFRALRLCGLIGITITFLVYHAVLSHLYEFDGWAAVADQLTHTFAPLLAIAAFLAGPHGWLERRTVALALIPPALWAAFTLVRGEIIGWYPYPFIDVGEHGYPVVLVNIALVVVLFYGLGRGALWLDGRLARRSAPG